MRVCFYPHKRKIIISPTRFSVLKISHHTLKMAAYVTACITAVHLLTCLPLLPGLPVGPLFPEIPGSPFGPISPCTTNQINSTFSLVTFENSNSKTPSCLSAFLTFCPSIPGKPIAPCGWRTANYIKHICTIVLPLSFATTPPVRSAHLVAFHATLTTITSRTLMERITGCYIP